MIAIGRLRHRLVLEAPARTSDGAGGAVVQWTPVACMWAEIRPIRQASGVKAEKMAASVTHRITVRSGCDVTTSMRFRQGERIFEIDGLQDDDGRGRFLTYVVRERLVP